VAWRTPATRRVPGRQKASRLPRRRAPSRGTSRRGSKAGWDAEGSPNLRERVCRRPRGARLATEEGNLEARSHGTRREGAGYLRLRASRPTTTHRHRLDHPRRDRRWTRDAASHAAPGGAVSLGAPPHASLLLNARRYPWCGVARCLLFLGRGKASARRAPREGRAGSGGQRDRNGRQRPEGPARARIGRSRSCSRVDGGVAEVVRRCSAQRSGRSPSHPIWKAFRDGRLARGTTCASTRATGEPTPVPPECAETSRDRTLTEGAARAGRGKLVMEGVSDRRWVYPSRNAHPNGLGRLGRASLCESMEAAPGSDRDVRGTAESRAHGRIDAARELGAARRSGLGVVKRPVPQSPSSWAASPRRRGEAQASKRCWERTRRECS